MTRLNKNVSSTRLRCSEETFEEKKDEKKNVEDKGTDKRVCGCVCVTIVPCGGAIICAEFQGLIN